MKSKFIFLKDEFTFYIEFVFSKDELSIKIKEVKKFLNPF